MTTNRKFSGEFVDFDKVKSRKSSCETIIEVNNQWLLENADEVGSGFYAQTLTENKNAQVEIEKLNKVLTTEPPPSVLPPRQPLFKVCGVLEEFSVQKVIGYFTDREYAPEEFAQQETSDQVGGLLLAITGNAAASAVTSQSRVRQDDASDFVRGKINGIPFHGWLGKTNAQLGDYVELAATGEEDHYVVYALAIPELRTISITPRCGCGREGEISFGKYALLIVGSPFLLLLIYLRFRGVDWTGVFFCAAIFLGMLMAAYFFAIRSIRKKPNPTTLLSESIFSVLGFPEPLKIDLPAITKKRLKTELLKVNNRPMPDRRAWQDYFFYY
ncbi:putative type VI secretion system effector [Rahnella aquatilis]|uniref:putative type VI secretion system effector n=1 Tax=Rahnella aquatilis TaxID=34038 RepID=UPI00365D92BC